MSKVANVLENNQESSKCLVFYDKSSIDSIFGAGIIRYICEEITDVGEEVECKDILLEPDNYADGRYLNVSFVNCYHKMDNVIRLYMEIYKENTLFILSNKTDYNKIKGFNRNVNIEYSEEDSCALQLYKIAFGEFKDRIPQIFQLISIGEMKKFDDENYYKAVQLGIGFNKYFKENGFETFYRNIILPICNQIDGYDNFDYSSFINDGKNISTYYNDYLIINSLAIKSDKFTFDGNKKTNVLFTNSMLDLSSENIQKEYQNEYILAFSKKDSYNWNTEFVFNSYSYIGTYVSELYVDKKEVAFNVSDSSIKEIKCKCNRDKLTIGDAMRAAIIDDPLNIFNLSYAFGTYVYADNNNPGTFLFYVLANEVTSYISINNQNISYNTYGMSYLLFNDEYHSKLTFMVNNIPNQEVTLTAYINNKSSEILNSYNAYNVFLVSYSYIAEHQGNCIDYVKKYYKGDGTKDHAFTTISNDQFLRIMKNKKF